MRAPPILLPDGEFDKHGIAERFRLASQHIEPHLAEFVYKRILDDEF